MSTISNNRNPYTTKKSLLNSPISHPFHLVDASPWPFIAPVGGLTLVLGLTLWFHNYKFGVFTLIYGLIMVIALMTVWWTDVVHERLYVGHHTKKVQSGLRLGMALFIISEVMFFFAFFWAYFALSLSPALEIGATWPPSEITPLNMWNVPLTNTIILLTSGGTLTISHQCLLNPLGRNDQITYLIITIFLAILFTYLQLMEYIYSSFDISDSCYGSVFFMMTGFHGIHVIIGTVFLSVGLIRSYLWHFSQGHHFGFEAAAWYWHFVDVVWLILFVCVYYWGSKVYDSEVPDFIS